MARKVSIFQRGDGKWCASIPLSGGRTKYLYGKDADKVRDRVGEWRMAGGEAAETNPPATLTAASGPTARPGKTTSANDPRTAAEWLIAWATGDHPNWGPRRRRDAQEWIRTHVAVPWKDLPIAAVDEEHVAALLDLCDHIPVTKDNLRRLLHVAFADRGTDNPVRNTAKRQKRVLKRSARRRFTVLEVEEWRRLLAACLASDRPIARLVGLVAETGLRSQEARALAWGAWDKEKHLLHIHRVVESAPTTGRGQRLQLSELTKTDNSYRSLPLTPTAERLLHAQYLAWFSRNEIIKHYRDVHDGEMTLAELEPPDTALIWASRIDTLLDASRLTNELNELVKAAEIGRHVRPLDLRHTHPSHLAAAGVDPVTIRKRMGWSSIKLLDVYADRVAAGDQTAVRTLDKISGAAAIEAEMERFRAAKQRVLLETVGVEQNIPF